MFKKCTFSTMNNSSIVSHSVQIEMTGLTLASTTSTFYGFATALLIWLMSADIFAQGVQNTLLPEINPQDIEIRSEFKANFPGLRRQPILGFTPRPRVFQIDPNRMPFLESREAAVSGISITALDRPQEPNKIVWITPRRPKVTSQLGMGWFVSPELRVNYYSPTEDGLIGVGTTLESSSGHLYDASGYRNLEVNINYSKKLSESKALTSQINLNNDFNRMYVLSDEMQNLLEGVPKKINQGIIWSARLDEHKNSFYKNSYAIQMGLFESELNSVVSAIQDKGSSSFIVAELNRSWPGQQVREYLILRSGVDVHSNKADGSANLLYLIRAGGGYSRLIDYTWAVDLETSLAYADDTINSSFYLEPDVNISYNYNDQLGGFARLSGKLKNPSLMEWQGYNRFLTPSTRLQHSYHLGVSVEVFWNFMQNSRIYSGLQWEQINRLGYAQLEQLEAINPDNPTANTQKLFYNLNYADAKVTKFYLGSTVEWLNGDLKGVTEISLRNPRLITNEDIPYEEKIKIEGSLSYTITPKLLLGASTMMIGPRTTMRSRKVDGFILVHSELRYSFNEHLGAYLRLNNLLSQRYEWWQGFQEAPLHLYGGISFEF
ncbi:MAG: hypothetical protein CL672_02030 [Balneola sp.]|nr:hypothetical protein [Balneola sp.]